MSNIVAIAVASTLAILLFPVHFTNYIYFNFGEKFAGISVRLYNFIAIKRINTIRNAPSKMLVDGKEKDFDAKTLITSARILFNNIYLTKIIQLGDFGAQSELACSLCAVQNCISVALYTYLKSGGNKGKLRNYGIINHEHKNIIYYAKISGATNLVASIKILIILLSEKLNEQIKK